MINHPNRSKKTKAEKTDEAITSFKGFDKDFQCRGHQFEVGKTYEVSGEIEACSNGFHACEYPLHIFQYYKPSNSRFAIVKQSGALSRHDGDSKIASAKITIKAEITLPQLIERAVKYVFDRAKWKEGPVATGDNEGVTASGYSGAATASGDSGAATASGYYGAATASGYSGAATASGNSGAATASGNSGAATASGYYGAATASGNSGAATASGYKGRARGKDGCALFLVERDDNYKILSVWAGIVGKDGIKPDTFYVLKNGKPVEA